MKSHYQQSMAKDLRSKFKKLPMTKTGRGNMRNRVNTVVLDVYSLFFIHREFILLLKQES